MFDFIIDRLLDLWQSGFSGFSAGFSPPLATTFTLGFSRWRDGGLNAVLTWLVDNF